MAQSMTFEYPPGKAPSGVTITAGFGLLSAAFIIILCVQAMLPDVFHGGWMGHLYALLLMPVPITLGIVAWALKPRSRGIRNASILSIVGGLAPVLTMVLSVLTY